MLYLVTGGTGFLGSALVRRLLDQGDSVRILDDNSRGRMRRLHDCIGRFEFVQGDIRDAAAVDRAVAGVDGVCHLAFINGTEFFYTKPDLVLDVGVKGMVNVLDACLKHQVGELMLVSSSEVYQTPPRWPADESVPLSIPDPLNPRYSYAAGKIISEMMAINYGRQRLRRVTIVRPHNVYGPDMGDEHVIPQLARRVCKLHLETPAGQTLRLPIQGTGQEQRAFVHVSDFTNGVVTVLARGEHLNIYNIGVQEEVTMAELARMVASCFGRQASIQPGTPAAGGTLRRCPDIGKISRLGYRPAVPLQEGLRTTVRWYAENADAVE